MLIKDPIQLRRDPPPQHTHLNKSLSHPHAIGVIESQQKDLINTCCSIHVSRLQLLGDEVLNIDELGVHPGLLAT